MKRNSVMANNKPKNISSSKTEKTPEKSGKTGTIKACNSKELWICNIKLFLITVAFVIGGGLIVVFQNYYLNVKSAGVININTTEDFRLLFDSYQNSLVTYNTTLCVFFGLFSLLSLAVGFMAWNGANKLDKMNEELLHAKSMSHEMEIELTKAKDQNTTQGIKDEAHYSMAQGTKEGFEEAIRLYTKCLNLGQEEWMIYNDLGYCSNELCKYENAIKYLYKAIEINPMIGKAYNNLWISLAKTGKYVEAVNKYSRPTRDCQHRPPKL